MKLFGFQLIWLAPGTAGCDGVLVSHIFLRDLLSFCITLSSAATGNPSSQEPEEESKLSLEKAFPTLFVFISNSLDDAIYYTMLNRLFLDHSSIRNSQKDVQSYLC
jgi:hypothetical protein